ncbi:DUF4252 domain-containing protein [Candidatus Poribacteria bacterium]|nr:DUF4252 domain-containing protein [Candidatus Poribacteria bacterium]
MKRSTLTALLTGIAFLAVCCFFTNGHAQNSNLEETTRGKIEMNLPDAPVPKVEINLDKSLLGLFINFGIASNPKLAGDGSVDLSEYTAYAEMLKGASIRAYDKEMKDLDQMVDHYRGILENEKWEHLVKIRDKFDLSLLYAEKSGVVHGIFVMFTDDGNSGFVNIYGEINFQKLGTLFGQLLESNSEEAISETVRNWIKAPMPHRWEVKRNAEKPDHALKSETTATNR